MSKIYYHTTLFGRPAGGVRTIFRHVAALRALGWDARVLSAMEAHERPGWFTSEVPVESSRHGVEVNADDVLVLPEVAGIMLRTTRGLKVRKVLFCQNQYAMFMGLGDDFPGWREAGVDHAIYCSETVKTMTERCFTFESSGVVRCVVNREQFRPAEKRMRVVFMVRKRSQDEIHLIRKAFERMWPQYADRPWTGLVNRTEAEVAAAMNEAAVFLSMNYREGLGLPPLEAMSAGCIVAGYTGLGGDEYATPDNGFWAPEEDVFAVAHAIGQAIHTVLHEPARAEAMRQAGYETVARYSAEGMVADLKAFWTRMVGPPESPGSDAEAVAAVLA